MPKAIDIRNPRVYLTVIAVLFLYALTFLVRNPFWGDILTMVFLFAALSLSWNILGGYAGQFSLGHAGLFGIGAYASTILYTEYGLSPWLGMLFGGTLAAIVGAMVFYPCFRLKGIFFCLASLAFTEVLRILATHFRDLTHGAMGIAIPFKAGLGNLMFRGKTGYMLIALSFMVGIALVSLVLKRSRLGYKLAALREDEDTTETLGVSTAGSKFIATLISGFFTGCLGTFYAHYTLLIDPESVFNVMLSVEFALLAILGGIGTVFGPIIGAFVLIPIDSLLRGYLGQAQQGLSFFAYGALLIIVVLFLPEGVISWMSRFSNRVLAALPGGSRDKAAGPAQPESGPAVTLAPASERIGPPLLEIKNLEKNFGGLNVISGLDMNVHRGEIVGLIGPNGAGKTTLFNLVIG
ncbi:MAG: ATP-binding cassette domain-containing protein, partial [Deltaproteobacteria bacterium]|nr:ATP-binding cassette domain-containing protein [Deltaproteobacteria bacterium]